MYRPHDTCTVQVRDGHNPKIYECQLQGYRPVLQLCLCGPVAHSVLDPPDQRWKTIRSLYSNAIVIVLMTSKTIDGRIKSGFEQIERSGTTPPIKQARAVMLNHCLMEGA